MSSEVEHAAMPITEFRFQRPCWIPLLLVGLLLTGAVRAEDPDPRSNARQPRNESELRYWLQNMVWHHRFTTAEVEQATGLSPTKIAAALKRNNIRNGDRPPRSDDAPLLVLPYPGGRHPRIGFLDGAIRPQRETKFSVFTPWDPTSYVVADVPEAIWSNLGLTYLAHTHIDTIWTKQNVTLRPQEWTRGANGTLALKRRLPNGIVFSTQVTPGRHAVRMSMTLTNGTSNTLTGLRVQNCVMLKGAPEFRQQTVENKIFRKPYAACRSDDGHRWVITAWTPCQRVWGNQKCPCLHADPQFPDCPPGATRHVRGWLSFYEGTDIQGEFDRIQRTGWSGAQ